MLGVQTLTNINKQSCFDTVCMKTLPACFKSMYVVTAALLLLLAAVASYNMRVFPANLLMAIASCSLLDAAISKLFLKIRFKFPASAFITGIIIGSIAPLNAPVGAVLVAAAVAIISKYVVRLKGRHIFNPATLGLLVSLSLFGLGDVWWAAAAGITVLGFSVQLMPILVFASYTAGKLKASIPFLLAVAVLYAATGFVSMPLTVSGILAFVSSMPYYFAFIMLSEPKTSPYAPREQLIFGTSAAVLVFALEHAHVKYPFFIALLAGNLAYSLHRSGFLQKKHKHKL